MFFNSSDLTSVNSLKLLEEVQASYSPLKFLSQPQKMFNHQLLYPNQKMLNEYCPAKITSKKSSNLSIQECEKLINQSLQILNSSSMQVSQQQLSDIRTHLRKYSQITPQQQQSFGQKTHEIKLIFERLQEIITQVEDKISLASSKRQRENHLRVQTLSFQKAFDINVENNQQLKKVASSVEIFSSNKQSFQQIKQQNNDLQKNQSSTRLSRKSTSKFINMTLQAPCRKSHIMCTQIALTKQKNKGINVYSVQKLKKQNLIRNSSEQQFNPKKSIIPQNQISKQDRNNTLILNLLPTPQKKQQFNMSFQKNQVKTQEQRVKQFLPLQNYENMTSQENNHKQCQKTEIEQPLKKNPSSKMLKSQKIGQSNTIIKGKSKTKGKQQKNLRGQLLSYKLKNPSNFYNMKRVSKMRIQ